MEYTIQSLVKKQEQSKLKRQRQDYNMK